MNLNEQIAWLEKSLQFAGMVPDARLAISGAVESLKRLQAIDEQLGQGEAACEVVEHHRNALYLVRTEQFDLPIGAKLYTGPQPQPVTNGWTINQAAKLIAKAFDYPWDAMPDHGRDNLRKIAGEVLALAGR